MTVPLGRLQTTSACACHVSVKHTVRRPHLTQGDAQNFFFCQCVFFFLSARRFNCIGEQTTTEGSSLVPSRIQRVVSRAFVLSLTCACVSLWRARAIKAQGARSHAHANLLHPDSLQMHEESRLAGQAAIVVGAGQTATLLAP